MAFEKKVLVIDDEIQIRRLLRVTLEAEGYLHAHATFAGADYQVFGGHLAAAVISATVELCIQQDDGPIKRAFNPTIGLNIYDF